MASSAACALASDVAPELPLPAALPDVAVLRAIVRRLLSVQRAPRSETAVLQGEVRDAADRLLTTGGNRKPAP